MTMRVCEMLLHHYNTADIIHICKSLNLDLYQEENMITISGKQFVLDIDNNNAICFISFVDDSYSTIITLVETYLNLALRHKNFLMFFYLLKYFVKIDETTVENRNFNCRSVRRGSFYVCECVFDEIHCVFKMQSVITKKMNVFTHRNYSTNENSKSNENVSKNSNKNLDHSKIGNKNKISKNIESDNLNGIKLFVINDTIFEFDIIDNKILFYDELIDEAEVEKRIKDNFLFYRAIDDRFRFVNNMIVGLYNGNEIIIMKDMSFYNVIDGKRERNSVMSYLLKRGLLLYEAIELMHEW